MDAYSDPQYKTQDGSALRIWRDAAKNNYLSEKLGRAVFDEVVYVEVISPGSRDSTPVFECVRVFAPEMNHPEPLYGIKYAEYKPFIEEFDKVDQTDASMTGTPLSEWPEMTRGMTAQLKAQSIFTVDALAALPDAKLVVVGPDGRAWRDKAIAYIENAKDGAYATGLAAEITRMRTDADAREGQIKELAAQVAALTAQIATGAPPAAAEAQPPAKPGKPAQAPQEAAQAPAAPVAPVAPVAPPII